MAHAKSKEILVRLKRMCSKLNQNVLMETKQIVLVHDGLVVSGGAERVVTSLCQILPEAPLYTSAWLPQNTFDYFKDHPPHVMPVSQMVRSERGFKLLYPLWWFGFRNQKFNKADLIFSSSSYLSKYLKPPTGIPHICYLHNPFRYLWDRDSYEKESLPLSKSGLRIADIFLPLLRRIDRRLTGQITHIIANSKHMAARIQSIYDREADVVYPPISIADFPFSSQRSDFYLFVGRLLSYKKIDLAIRACQEMGRKLLIVGSGPEETKLREMADEQVEFLGRVSDKKLKQLYAQARGLISPGLEDFGLIPVEAQATGCPVIAYGAGGVLESVIANQTGVFFKQQSSEALQDAIKRFEKKRFDHTLIRQNVQRFDLELFKHNIFSIVNRYLPANKKLQ